MFNATTQVATQHQGICIMTVITKWKHSSWTILTGRTLSNIMLSGWQFLMLRSRFYAKFQYISLCIYNSTLDSLNISFPFISLVPVALFACMVVLPSSAGGSRTQLGRKKGDENVTVWQKGDSMHSELTTHPRGPAKHIGSRRFPKERLVKRNPLSDSNQRTFFWTIKITYNLQIMRLMCWWQFKKQGLQPLLMASEWSCYYAKGQKTWENERHQVEWFVRM